ncbi:transporter [Alkalihalobacillus alcalophilus ATCC 27647 = CGMCC 1.3604]|uniref:Transporter n=1 Tax=Alkalihalobacillus alcalophilus ATCC 27647 = CGMCC 1.3604 TaxID=1218173 RepID=J8QCZ7_ALKAL|nr:EamA family transporter [Alkalihalobacillus alcalophilus]AFV25674.1 drug/putative metabolite transporter [Alkalihalobacillus alcalophilus ATCC 27647 = CGMCC 1.3604]KGA96475.1 transporter [Alkalihalobacillus alcalophilus ATCC 27647 = CGMCC 1.3604]MED1562319.1 EamA family transporter [Alkalihalobacillus alcalophilus]THG90906.1 transporter [Alkalihalobacillus alcalophilus ATCC 27647 = CGMCC 1.3604]
MEKRLAYLSIALGATFWGMIGVFVNYLYELGFTPIQVVALRAGTAMIFLLIYLSLFKKNRPALKMNIKDSHYFIGTGVISIVFFNLCLFYAMQETSISVATILLYTAPAFVTIFSRFLFKEVLTAKKTLALFMTLIGCAFVIGVLPNMDGTISLIGFMLGLGSGLFYALYSIFGKYALQKYSPLTVTFYTFVFAAVAIIPFSGIWTMAAQFTSLKVWLLVLGLGFFSTMLAFIFYTRGLQHVESSRASIIATVEPVVAAVMSFLLFSEKLSIWQYLGMAFVLLAVIVVQESKGRIEHKSEQAKESY